jgi:hypothetical protein
VALAQELRVPGQARRVRGPVGDPAGEAGGGADRDGRLPDDQLASTYFMSAANSPFFWGVPTQTKCTAEPAASLMSVVNFRRPVAIVRSSSSGSPGS